MLTSMTFILLFKKLTKQIQWYSVCVMYSSQRSSPTKPLWVDFHSLINDINITIDKNVLTVY